MARSFKTWIKAVGLMPKRRLTLKGKERLLAMYEADESPDDKEKETAEEEADEIHAEEEELDEFGNPKKKVEAEEEMDEFGNPKKKDEEVIARLADLLEQREQIREIKANYPDIAAEAIEGDRFKPGWSLTSVRKLAEVRASREGPLFITGGGRSNVDRGLVIQAAACQALGIRSTEKDFTDQVLQAAHTEYKGQIGLQEMIHAAAVSNGYRGGSVVQAFRSDHAGVLRAAYQIRAAGFSTVSLPGIMSNVMYKSLLESFNHVEQSWSLITARKSVKDFKQITSYRMLDSMQFEKVGAAGEIKHGELSEESFTNQADTYGKMFSVTRRDQINDDLGALQKVPKQIGRGAALKLNDVFWTEFCGNTGFADPSQHFYKGADSVLASAGLAKVLAKFRAKTETTATGSPPLSIEPKILLVPSALEITAAELMSSTNYNTGGSSTTDKVPNKNVWMNRFQIVQSAYLDNASYGNSTVIWYMLADPADIAVIETCFLNGKETPTVESADADFNTLGMQFRGYFDFGVNNQDVRGGVKSKGAA